MFKKFFISGAVSLISLSALAMPTPDVTPTALTLQLNHVNAQINAAKRAWKESLLRITMARKASPDLYLKTQHIIEKIIASNAFTTRMNITVNEQFESIVHNNASFREVKIENTLSDVTFKTMHVFTQQLYTAMANKAYYFLLGQKLAQKSKELATTIRAAQHIASDRQESVTDFSF